MYRGVLWANADAAKNRVLTSVIEAYVFEFMFMVPLEAFGSLWKQRCYTSVSLKRDVQ